MSDDTRETVWPGACDTPAATTPPDEPDEPGETARAAETTPPDATAWPAETAWPASTLPPPDAAPGAEAPAPAEGGPAGLHTVGPLAEGGMGSLELVEDRGLGRRLARKRIHPRFAQTPRLRARFLREARVLARLQHPGVVPVHALGTDPDGTIWFTMKLIEGHTLARELVRAPPEDRARQAQLLQVWERIAETIAFAHSVGILHRDLKPDNVMVGRFGEVQVLDWGLAGFTDEGLFRHGGAGPALAPGLTRHGSRMGTPGWSAPEQLAGEASGTAADIWSLGALLCFVRTGQRVASPDADPRLPAPLRSVLAAAQHAEPAQRYPTVDALLADVRAWQRGDPVSVHEESLREQAGRWNQRHGPTAGVVGLAVGGLVATAAALQLSLANAEIDALRTEAEQRAHHEAARVALADQRLDQAAVHGAALAESTTLDAVADALLRPPPRLVDQRLLAGHGCGSLDITADGGWLICGGRRFEDAAPPAPLVAWSLHDDTVHKLSLSGTLPLAEVGAVAAVVPHPTQPRVRSVSAHGHVWEHDLPTGTTRLVGQLPDVASTGTSLTTGQISQVLWPEPELLLAGRLDTPPAAFDAESLDLVGVAQLGANMPHCGLAAVPATGSLWGSHTHNGLRRQDLDQLVVTDHLTWPDQSLGCLSTGGDTLLALPYDARKTARAELFDTVPDDGGPVTPVSVSLPTGARSGAVSPDGARFAVGLVDGTVLVGQTRDGAVRARITVDSGGDTLVRAVAWHPDSRHLAAAAGETVRTYDVDPTGLPAPVDLPSGARDLTALASGWATCEGVGRVRFFDEALRPRGAPVDLPERRPHCALFPDPLDPDTVLLSTRRPELWALSLDGRAAVRHTAGARTNHCPRAAGPDGAVFVLDRGRWSIAPADDLGAGQALGAVQGAGYTSAYCPVLVEREGRSMVLAATHKQGLLGWELAQPAAPPVELSRDWGLDPRRHSLQDLHLDPTGTTLAAPLGTADVLLADVATLQPTVVDSAVYEPRELAFSPDGRWLAVGGASDRIELVSVEERAVRLTLHPGYAHVAGLSWTGPRRLLVLGTPAGAGSGSRLEVLDLSLLDAPATTLPAQVAHWTGLSQGDSGVVVDRSWPGPRTDRPPLPRPGPELQAEALRAAPAPRPEGTP